MDPSSVPKPVFSLIYQARQTLSKSELVNNFFDLNTEQCKLLIKLLTDTKKYTPVEDHKIHKMIEVLSGISTNPVAASPNWTLKMLSTLKESVSPLERFQVHREKTTNDLFKELMGTSLVTNDKLTSQLYRDYSGLIGHIEINGTLIEMQKKPPNQPDVYQQLIPEKLKDFIGPNYKFMEPYIGVMLTQGIAADPTFKGMETIKDPLFPDARFVGVDAYPQFNFEKNPQNEVILTVTTRGALKVTNDGGVDSTTLRSYIMKQTINLSRPDELVMLTLHPG